MGNLRHKASYIFIASSRGMSTHVEFHALQKGKLSIQTWLVLRGHRSLLAPDISSGSPLMLRFNWRMNGQYLKEHSEATVNEKVDVLNRLLLNLYDEFAPGVNKRAARAPAPWLTQEIRALMQQRLRWTDCLITPSNIKQGHERDCSNHQATAVNLIRDAARRLSSSGHRNEKSMETATPSAPFKYELTNNAGWCTCDSYNGCGFPLLAGLPPHAPLGEWGMGDPRADPLAIAIFRHDSHMRKYGSDLEPGSHRWEARTLTATRILKDTSCKVTDNAYKTELLKRRLSKGMLRGKGNNSEEIQPVLRRPERDRQSILTLLLWSPPARVARLRANTGSNVASATRPPSYDNSRGNGIQTRSGSGVYKLRAKVARGHFVSCPNRGPAQITAARRTSIPCGPGSTPDDAAVESLHVADDVIQDKFNSRLGVIGVARGTTARITGRIISTATECCGFSEQDAHLLD
ncbi:hypothetical protein PR048_009400 [Dryococelus australis]|uniref:Uncharacterized protein n=1 Tax=Dryococelus australis TaxID=614101 RepID=A0ABQ9HZS4_9NEOP|nr:hypothetical protein PR048_009400 [Dryococelus australis]